MDFKQLNTLESFCKDVMRCDQYPLQRRLRQLKNNLKSGKKLDPKTVEKLTLDIEKSLRIRQQRLHTLPQPDFPDDLPVSQRREDIAAAIKAHQVVVIAGETGSGKTTQIPKICLSLGRGVAGLIGCTQPRRIAARSISQRVASELQTELGQAVGYKVRFHDHLSPDTYIKFMTDGILLAETQNDRFLNQYDTLIIDEAHERSLNIDFLLGYLRQLLPKRPDLKLIITSATIDTERFATHFNNAPVIEVSGRTYPVEVRYHQLDSDEEDEQDRNIQHAIVDAVDEITLHDRQADILIFLSGERDIRETAESLRKHKLQNTEILPLYARLSAAEQNRVFAPSQQRRIVLATNVAETSLTVPGIKAVIDPGLARISRYSIRNKVQRLPIEKIAQSSANQRKGRCGRIAPGLCIRLYSELDFKQRPEFTDPEILRTSLASVILQMLALKLGDIEDFPFIDPPSPKMINDGFNLLIELGAVDSKRQLTEVGRQLAKLPIDPRIARMILAGQQEACLTEVLIIASALSIQDPRERPLDAQEAADAAQQKFADEKSDFLSFLKLWEFFHENAQHLSKNKLRQLCHEHFLAYLRMREWQDIHQQLTTLIKESGWKLNQQPADYPSLHRALLTGLLGNIAFKSPEDHYLGARSIKLWLFPGSGLFKKQPKWMMCAELVETSKLFGRCVARIEPDWIEAIAGELCNHSYFEPHWEKRAADVAAFEKVTLYGLTIVPKRKVNYGALDPKLARELFIRHALVEGDYRTQAAFFQHNRELINEIEALEHKSRRQDILVDEEQIYDFYAARIPDGIYSGKSFEKWRKQAEREQPKLLFLSRDDLMQQSDEHVTKTLFPDHITVNGVDLSLHYHFQPGHERDGVTVDLPLALLNQLPSAPFEWLVLGLLEEKLTALIRGLPKPVRKAFVPVPDVAKAAYLELSEQVTAGHVIPHTDLYTELERFLQRKQGKPLADKHWDIAGLPLHLRMNFCLLDNAGQFLAMERDFAALQARWRNHAAETCRQEVAVDSGIERDNITRWDFDELPTQITLSVNGIAVQGFPTLEDKQTHVALRVLDNPNNAAQMLTQGLHRLYWLALPTKKLLKQMPISAKLSLQYVKVGNPEELKAELLSAVIERLFLVDPLPRTQQVFEQRLQAGQSQVIKVANEYANYLADIMANYTVLTQELNVSELKSLKNTQEIRQHLQHLVYPGFVKEVPLSQLQHLPRYLKAIRLRVERLLLDPAKDRNKATQIQPMWQAYLEKRQQMSDPLPQLEEFRWLLEEFRVSIFAQELRTACPVSKQRLQQMWKGL